MERSAALEGQELLDTYASVPLHPFLGSESDELALGRMLQVLPEMIENFFSVLDLYLSSASLPEYEHLATQLQLIISKVLRTSAFLPKNSILVGGKPDMGYERHLAALRSSWEKAGVTVAGESMAWRVPVTRVAAQLRVTEMISIHNRRMRFFRNAVSLDDSWIPILLVMGTSTCTFSLGIIALASAFAPHSALLKALSVIFVIFTVVSISFLAFLYLRLVRGLDRLYNETIEERSVAIPHAPPKPGEPAPSPVGARDPVESGGQPGIWSFTTVDRTNISFPADAIHTSTVMVGVDQKLRIIFWNKAAAVLTGYSQMLCAGAPLAEYASFDPDSLLESRPDVPIRIALKAFATPSVALNVHVIRLFKEKKNIGYLIVGAFSGSEFQSMFRYFYRCRIKQIRWFIQRQLEGSRKELLTPELERGFRSIETISELADWENIAQLTNNVQTDWEWTNAINLLAPLNDRCTLSIAENIPSAFQVNARAVGEIVSCLITRRLHPTLDFKAQFFDSDFCVLIVELRSKAPYDADEINESIRDDCIATGVVLDFSNDYQTIYLQIPTLFQKIVEDTTEAPLALKFVGLRVTILISSYTLQQTLTSLLLSFEGIHLRTQRSVGDLEFNSIDLIVTDIVHSEVIKQQAGTGVDMIVCADGSVSAESLNGDNKLDLLYPPFSRSQISSRLAPLAQRVARRKQEEDIIQKRFESPWVRGKCLGKGAMGAVYEAEYILTGGKMAVKEFYSNDAANKMGLLNEIQIMCRLKHPNIVHYFHCEDNGDSLNVFMELCDGSLADAIKSSRPLNIPAIMRQIVEAIEYLHSQNIVHRDIKPHNILLKGDDVKLADFGTAVVSEEALRETKGTLRFMAPEVYQGKEYGTSSDIWSIGCVLCELFNVKPTFMRPGKHGLLETLDQVQIPSKLQNPLSRDFLKACLQVDRTKRPTAHALKSHPFLRVSVSDKNQSHEGIPQAVNPVPTATTDDATGTDFTFDD